MSLSSLSRRNFISQASCFGAFYGVAQWIKLPLIEAALADDGRVAEALVVDKGFASVRKIGNGLYATISDPSKGRTTLCNGGFMVGKDSALVLEGFASPGGPAFQLEALRTISQAPVQAAVDTHYHFDHSMGNAFYGANGIPLWAHASAGQRIIESYGPLQGVDKATALASYEKRVSDAKSETEKAHAQGDLNAMTGVFLEANSNVLAVPNHSLDPTKLPMKVDLGGLTASLESFSGAFGD